MTIIFLTTSTSTSSFNHRPRLYTRIQIHLYKLIYPTNLAPRNGLKPRIIITMRRMTRSTDRRTTMRRDRHPGAKLLHSQCQQREIDTPSRIVMIKIAIGEKPQPLIELFVSSWPKTSYTVMLT